MITESEIKAGYLYRRNIAGDMATYIVCIGKTTINPFCYAFVELGDINVLVPCDATLENYPLSKHFSNPKNRVITLCSLDMRNLDYYTYLGKVCDETEQEIKAWITRFKLMGFEVKDYLGGTHEHIILGNWRNRSKNKGVKRYRVGKLYIEDIGNRNIEVKNRRIWRYLGKQGKYFVWESKLLKDKYWDMHHKFDKQLEHMVVYKPNEER
jgi:hypothetical protein